MSDIFTHAPHGQIKLFHPLPEQFPIWFIAKSLSRLARWTGYTDAPYSIAQHSILVARNVSKEAKPYALLHDAHEAVIGDITTPVKRALKELNGYDSVKELTGIIDEAIYERYDLDWPVPKHIKQEVHEADLAAAATEYRDLLSHHDDNTPTWVEEFPKPFAEQIIPVPWWEAELWFMEEAKILGLR